MFGGGPGLLLAGLFIGDVNRRLRIAVAGLSGVVFAIVGGGAPGRRGLSTPRPVLADLNN